MKSKRFKDTRTGEIVTQVPLSQFKHFVEFDYHSVQERIRKRTNDFPMRFAFNTEQLEAVIAELGPPETLLKLGNTGGFVRKSDREALDAMTDQNEKEMQEALTDDEVLHQAIVYELGNHEYCITHDSRDAIEALGIDLNDDRVKRIFRQAKEDYLNGCAELA